MMPLAGLRLNTVVQRASVPRELTERAKMPPSEPRATSEPVLHQAQVAMLVSPTTTKSTDRSSELPDTEDPDHVAAPQLIVKLKHRATSSTSATTTTIMDSGDAVSEGQDGDKGSKVQTSASMASTVKEPENETLEKARNSYVHALLSHKRKRGEDEVSELEDLRKKFARQEKENASLRQDVEKSKSDSELLKELKGRWKHFAARIKSYEDTIMKYAKSAEACKPIILDAIESKWYAELGGHDDKERKLLAAEKARADYKELFEVSDTALSKK